MQNEPTFQTSGGKYSLGGLLAGFCSGMAAGHRLHCKRNNECHGAAATDILWNPSPDFDDMGNPLLPTDEEGLNRLRWAAINLGASATAMNAPDQLVDVPGTPAPDDTVLSADEMNALKQQQYGTWVAFSRQLELLAAEYEAAIEAGDSEAFGWSDGALGSKMNNICTACHTVFWYPNAPAPY